jgi:hypothetical protein
MGKHITPSSKVTDTTHEIALSRFSVFPFSIPDTAGKLSPDLHSPPAGEAASGIREDKRGTGLASYL